MLIKFGLLLSIVVAVVVHCENVNSTDEKLIWQPTATDRLKRDLLKNYDKFARPAEPNKTTTCNLGLSIRHIEVDESRSIMTIYSWLRMKWQDHKLQWNESDYGGLTTLHVAEHEVWQPDIVLYNNAGANLDHYGQTMLILFNSGEILWVPPAQLSVFCELDMTYWPFDTQNCSFVLGSWTYHGLALDIDRDQKSPVELELQIENSEWLVTNVHSYRHDKYYSCCTESYPDITYSIQIQRRSATYKTIVLTPATVIVLLILAGFWLPAASGEKIFLNGIVAVIITLFMLYFAQHVSIMAYHTPLVVKFYATSLVLVCYSIIISVVVLACSRSQHAHAVPWFLKRLTDGPLGKLLLLSHLKVPPTAHRGEELRENSGFDEPHVAIIQSSVTKVATQLEWVILGTAIDRLSFLIYAVVFAIIAIIYSV